MAEVVVFGGAIRVTAILVHGGLDVGILGFFEWRWFKRLEKWRLEFWGSLNRSVGMYWDFDVKE